MKIGFGGGVSGVPQTYPGVRQSGARAGKVKRENQNWPSKTPGCDEQMVSILGVALCLSISQLGRQNGENWVWGGGGGTCAFVFEASSSLFDADSRYHFFWIYMICLWLCSLLLHLRIDICLFAFILKRFWQETAAKMTKFGFGGSRSRCSVH